MKIIDISLPINNQTPIYPWNVPVSVNLHQQMPKDSSTSSSITLGSHTGTHIDAPSHAILGAKNLDAIPLIHFIGNCRVLDFSEIHTESVTKEMLLGKNIQKGERVILKTSNSLRGFKEFYPDYVYLSGEGAEYLASLDVSLVGIDALSIKQKGSSDHRPHLALLSKDIPIIEGLNLKYAEESSSEINYEIFCPPLYLTDIDGAPTRAILIQK
jgi:arylformamidase